MSNNCCVTGEKAINKNLVSYYSIDIAKIIMSILIVAGHTNAGYPYNSLFKFFLRYLTTIAVPFFFMSASFLFFNKYKESYNSRDRLKKFVFRNIKLYIVWQIMIVLCCCVQWILTGQNYKELLGEYFLEIIILAKRGHLWFVHTLVISVCLINLLNKWVHPVGVCKLFLTTFLLGALMNNFYKILIQLPYFDAIYNMYFMVFQSSRNTLLIGGGGAWH